MKAGKLLRTLLFLLPAVIIITALLVNVKIADANTPVAENGVLDLAAWNPKKDSAFNIAGEFMFFWDRLVTASDIGGGEEDFILVDTPDTWDSREVNGTVPGGNGRATYALHVSNAAAGTNYAIRIQNMASAYKLYVDDRLVASNGSFGDSANAAASGYRPQLAAFSIEKDSFDIVLQISNDAYAVGGMWEPILFGSEKSVTFINDLLKFITYFSFGSLAFVSAFFLIIFFIAHREKELLILSGIGLFMLIRLLINGDMTVAYILPNMPISGFGWIDYLTLIWVQFFVLYFIYCAFASIVGRWQVLTLLGYTVLVTLFVFIFPFGIVSGAYIIMNLVLLFVLTLVTVHTARAALKNMRYAGPMLSAMALILSFIL